MKKFILFLIFSIFLAQQVSSTLTTQIYVQSEFHPGEMLAFNYRFFSSTNEEVIYTPYIVCPKILMPILEMQEATLLSGQVIERSYELLEVEPEFETQNCVAKIDILSPIQKTVSKNFSIITNPSFDFNIKLAKRVFTFGETIKIDYSSSVSDPQISATLNYPDGKSKSVTLPATIKADKIGTYELEVNASKEGYKTITAKEQFAVIKSKANIGYVALDDSDKGVKNNVNVEDKQEKSKLIFWIFIGTLILLAVVILFFIIKQVIKKNEQENI